METIVKKIVDCKLCGGKSVFFISKNCHDLFQCEACGLIFVWPIPQNLSVIYEQDYFSGATHGFGYADYDTDKSAMTDTFLKYLKIIEKYSGGVGSLLDVGAATGFFLGLALRNKWDVTGVEISDFAAEKARAKGLAVLTGTLDSVRFPKLFNVITMWDVIEHVSDPYEQIKKAYELLAPNGILIINTPDASSIFAKIMGKRWHLFVPPEHLYYFNPTNLAKNLSGAGFKVLEVGKLGKKFTLIYAFLTLARISKLRFIQNLADRLRGTSIGNLAVPINLRDNFFIIAKK